MAEKQPAKAREPAKRAKTKPAAKAAPKPPPVLPTAVLARYMRRGR